MTTWIFQGNPKLFDMGAYLSQQKEVLWRASQGHTLMNVGDLVYFWTSSENGGLAGVIASGAITEGPSERAMDEVSRRLWKGPSTETGLSRQVAIKMEVQAGQRFVPAAFLIADRVLGELEILKVPNATNFRVHEPQTSALQKVWSDAGHTPSLQYLASSLKSELETWRADPVAQETAKTWSAAAHVARPEVAELFHSFLNGQISVKELRDKFDGRTRTEKWQPLGLGGPNGAMVLNKWTKHFPPEIMTPQLLDAFALPTSVEEAQSKLRGLDAFLRTQTEEGGMGPKQAATSRAPALVSGVWDALDEGEDWPTFYTSARDAFIRMRVLPKNADKVAHYFQFRELIAAVRTEQGLTLDETTQFLKWFVEGKNAADLAPPTSERGTTLPIDSTERRIWLITPGRGAVRWDEWQKQNIADIGWDKLGDLRKYETIEATAEALTQIYQIENPINNKLTCFNFSHLMRSGDLVYAKTGRKTLLGAGVVAGEYRFDPARGSEPHTIPVRWTWTGNVQLPDHKVFIIKTLTEIGGYPGLTNLLQSLTSGGEDGTQDVDAGEVVAEVAAPEAYSIDDAAQDLFIEQATLLTMKAALKEKKNLILQGPPGVGKTFVAKRLAYLLMGQKAAEQVMTVQFHQSYSYEDFVQGFRPTESGGFKREDGPFFRFCEQAAQDQQTPYVLIIDEINRGNVSRIFGELLMLLEADKRGPEWAVHLAYSKADELPFFIPPNLHVIGTMNTADRSIALVDYALRRRFAFMDVEAGFESTNFGMVLKSSGLSEVQMSHITASLLALNKFIEKDPHLGAGYCIGHSYFCPGPQVTPDDDWLERVFQLEVEPLIREYFRDSPEKMKEALKLLELE